MTSKSDLVVYRTRGGLLSLTELRLIAEAATAQGEPRLYSVGRQEIALGGLGFAQASRLLGQPGNHILQPWSLERRANIMTTGPVAGLRGTSSWLSEGTIRDLLASFTFAPKRSVALADPSQTYLPAFLGEISFLAMEQRDLWRIRLALSELGEESLLPGAVRSMDIPKVVEIIERLAGPGTSQDPAEVFRAIAETLAPIQLHVAASTVSSVLRYQSPSGALVIPIPKDGIRSDFCIDFCVWAARQSGVSVGLTPWRTFLVRGLSDVALRELRALLIRGRVAESCNPWRAHSLNLLPEGDVDWMCQMLEAQCPVDTGLSVGLSQAGAPAPDVHVLVHEEPRTSWWGHFRPARYTVQHRDEGDARKGRWSSTATHIRRKDLGAVILRTIETAIGPAETAENDADAPADFTPDAAVRIYRCGSCLTEYDAAYGDPVSEIATGTVFDRLSEDWNCPVCGGPKSDYAVAAA